MPYDNVKLAHFLQSVRGGALAFASLRVWDEEVALDLLQEAMIGFVGAAKKHDEVAWKALFYKILGRRIVDWQRKQIWRNRIARMIPFSGLASDDDDPIDFAANTGNSDEPEQNHSADQLAKQFETVLASLPTRQQEAYLLRQWQGFNVKETAEIMKCSEGSVKTHLSRAMSVLTDQLGEWIDEE
ncbi:MAG: sigma-70 family RNA polymerase sigma factor [Gammaproteobacteria bacterium]|nr:sigma-70 family RNA polymerase sigma factor [Gammaproteobacteria bacterium]